MDLTEDTPAPYRVACLVAPPEPDFAPAAHAMAQQAGPWLVAFTNVHHAPAFVNYQGRRMPAISTYTVQVWDQRTAAPHQALGTCYVSVSAPTAARCLQQLAERFAAAAQAELLEYATSLASGPQL